MHQACGAQVWCSTLLLRTRSFMTKVRLDKRVLVAAASFFYFASVILLAAAAAGLFRNLRLRLDRQTQIQKKHTSSKHKTSEAANQPGFTKLTKHHGKLHEDASHAATRCRIKLPRRPASVHSKHTRAAPSCETRKLCKHHQAQP